MERGETGTASKDGGYAPPSSAFATELRRRLEAEIEKRTFPGLQYLVVDQAGVLFEFCGGQRDLANGLAVTPNTAFMASSSTKVLTAVAVLQLVEQGRIALDEALSSYLPWHPYGPLVTIRHLLNQTSGIPNPIPVRWVHAAADAQDFDEDRELRSILKRHSRLNFIPGTKYAYSNISYWLLGKVIEAVSEQSYCTYLREFILDPLKIEAGQLGCNFSGSDENAWGYFRRRSFESLAVNLLAERSYLSSANTRWGRFARVYMNGPAYGGLTGVARSFGLFLSDQLRPESALFSAETKELFYAAQTNNRGYAIPMTLGWHRGRLNAEGFFGKPGGGPGFQSNLRIYPALGIATAFFANRLALSEQTINDFSDKIDGQFATSRAS